MPPAPRSPEGADGEPPEAVVAARDHHDRLPKLKAQKAPVLLNPSRQSSDGLPNDPRSALQAARMWPPRSTSQRLFCGCLPPERRRPSDSMAE